MVQEKTSEPWWSKLNLINILMTIFGIRPVLDRPGSNSSKFSLIGILFALGHTITSGIVFHRKFLKVKFLSIFFNKVIYGTFFLQLVLNLMSPLFINICTVLQFSAMATFLDKLEYFDLSLEKHRVKFSELRISKIRVRKMTNWSLIIYFAFNIGMACWHHIVMYDSDLYQFLGVIYYAVIGLTSTRILLFLNEVNQRFDLFKVLLNNIKFNTSNRQFDVIPQFTVRYYNK